jgi:capsular polysaccharide biosynthesis protein
MVRRAPRAMPETSERAEGLTHRMLLHLLETFFRHPILHLLPLVLFVAFGVFTAVSAEKMYRSVGVLNATSGTLLNELTGDSPTFGFESTATVTSRNIEQMLSTDKFVNDVIERAGMTSAVESGVVTRDEIRSSISAFPQGDNLVAVAATTPRPEQSHRLAQATLDTFVEFVVSNDVHEANVEIGTYEDIRDSYLEDLNKAVADFNSYVLEHPAGDEDNRPVDEELEIARLQAAVDRAEESYLNAEDNINGAVLARNVARTVVTSQLQTIDEPQTPTFPQAGLRQAVMTVGIFGFLGLALALAMVVLASMLERTVRIADDVPAKFGVDVLAVVPPARRRSG